MQVKIFMGSGKDGVEKVEQSINNWLKGKDFTFEVKNTQTALCQVSENADGERYQCLAITIWYDEPSN